MNKIIELLKKGYFVQDIDILSVISDEDFEKILSFLPKTNEPKILKKEDILKILEKLKRRYELKIVTPEIKQKITNLDLLNILRERYNFLSSFLKRKLSFFNLISINKISKKYKTFSIIGIVYRINNKRITLEDLSSRIEIKIDKEEEIKHIEEDCVIGVKCYWKDDEIKAEEIIFPEFEEKKETEKIKIGFYIKEDFYNDVDISIIIGDENKISDNKIFLNKSIPVHQVYINTSLLLVINSSVINFNLQKFLKTRLVVTNANETIKYGSDIFLIRDKPNIIILYNSEKNSINKNDDVYLIEISREIKKGLIIDLKNEKIYEM